MLIVKGLQWTLLTYILQDNLSLRMFSFMWALKILIVYMWKWLDFFFLSSLNPSTVSKKYISWLCVSNYSSTCRIIHPQIYMSVPIPTCVQILSLSLSLSHSYTNTYFLWNFPLKCDVKVLSIFGGTRSVFPPG
jgi:hypothetical protein